ncbi:MAG: hypothetical protein KDH48_06555 [Rhodoferax sp.]|nr:hypothetical protein [Rhodoferax sp.]
MSEPSTAPPSATSAATVRSGALALAYTGKCLPLQVLLSAAGHYIGTQDDEGPVSRESVEYFPSPEAAQRALATDAWTQRSHP